jgi:tetratricopeptide (TPR) repeat protein
MESEGRRRNCGAASFNLTFPLFCAEHCIIYAQINKAAISYFNQAIDKDPGYALAYAGLANALGSLRYYGGDPIDLTPKANAAARKALELDPTLAGPHVQLGYNKMAFDRDFAGSEAEFRKAFELDPNDATAHLWFSQILCEIGGRAQEAIEEANRARQLDPLSAITGYQQAEAYTAARQYDKAIEISKKLIADNPDFGRVHGGLAQAYWAEHKYAEAIQELKTDAQLEGDKNKIAFAFLHMKSRRYMRTSATKSTPSSGSTWPTRNTTYP